MYVEKIKYVDYNGNERTDTLYFNLTKTEILRMDLTIADGNLSEYLKTIAESKNGQEIIDMFDKVLRAAYGVKSADGKRFEKSDDIYKAFTETEAYNEFFYRLVTDAEYAGKFVDGIISDSFILDQKDTTKTNTVTKLEPVKPE